MEEPEMRAQAAADPDHLHPRVRVGELTDVVEVQPAQAPRDPIDQDRVRVADPQDAARVAALGVEDACQESLAPSVVDLSRPLDQLANPIDARLRLGTDRLSR